VAAAHHLYRRNALKGLILPPMPEYQHDQIVPFKDSSLSKKRQVAEMFNHIANRYDFLNHFLSGGVDNYWRKRAIGELRLLRPKTILDIATGTGDLSAMMAKRLRPEKITGIDISSGMLERGRQKMNRLGLGSLVHLQEGDSEAIEFPDNSFDAVTVAFGVRNFQNLEKGLQEMRRVLKPGGKMMILEFSKPGKGFFRLVYKTYLRHIAPRVGNIVSGNGAAYQYLHDSVNAFPEGEDFKQILKKTGYTNVYSKRLSLGICSIYCGDKDHDLIPQKTVITA
jgi:demethylmenaquinone methyltransferase/2-methoxy-6-polyprenyl-1,4-benzoquinol methylase